jgi:hypothetical protein
MTAPTTPTTIAGRMRQAILDNRTAVILEPEPDMEPEQALEYFRGRLGNLRIQLRKVKDRMCFTHRNIGPGMHSRLWVDEDLLCILCGERKAETGDEPLRNVEARYLLKPGEAGTIRMRQRPAGTIREYFERDSSEWYRSFGSYPRFTAECLDPSPSATHCKYRITRLEDLHYNPRRLSPGQETPPVPQGWPYTPERWAEIQAEIRERNKARLKALMDEDGQADDRE